MSPVFVRRRTREAFELALDRNAPVELRLDALRAVAAAGSAQAAETLASLLDEDNDVIAELAVALLGHMPARRALAPLLDVMAGHDDLARLNAAEALGRIGEVAAGPALISALYSGDPDLRLVAARALGRVGEQRADLVPPLSVLEVGHLGEVDGAEHDAGRGQSAESSLYAEIEVAVVDRAALPAHPADESDGLHGGSLADSTHRRAWHRTHGLGPTTRVRDERKVER